MATRRRQRSVISARGRYAPSRLTTSAAVSSALSAPNGIDPWPGVPRTTNRRQAKPFSATFISTWRPPARPDTSPPFSVST